jgi:hypothetical protein
MSNKSASEDMEDGVIAEVESMINGKKEKHSEKSIYD